MKTLLTYLIALIWLANGVFCKILGLVPRHQQIVARILGESHAKEITILIGAAEVFMAIWVLSGKWRRQNAILQVVIVLTMNIIEFLLAPDLLLWGKFNLVFALFFVLVVAWWGLGSNTIQPDGH